MPVLSDLHRARKLCQEILDRNDTAAATVRALAREVESATGRHPLPGLASWDIDKEVEEIAEELAMIFDGEPPPAGLAALILLPWVELSSKGEPPTYVCHLTGQTDLRLDDFEWYLETEYAARRFAVVSDLLDAILNATPDDHPDTDLIHFGLLQPALVAIIRAALRGLGRKYAVVLSTGDVDPYSYVAR